jgi:hypothetical protein
MRTGAPEFCAKADAGIKAHTADAAKAITQLPNLFIKPPFEMSRPAMKRLGRNTYSNLDAVKRIK